MTNTISATVKSGSKRISQQTEVFASLVPFTTSGSLKGVKGTGQATLGQLPRVYVEQFDGDVVEYTIYSYTTPIAWFDTVRGWVIPDATYSVTTTIQQNAVKVGITMAGLEYTTI